MRRGGGLEYKMFIDWNGPSVHLVDGLGTRTLSRLFNGGKWHYIAIVKSGDSETTRKLKSSDAKLPFL